ncbi:hypothetical protein L0Z36_16950 [Burkholderia multivorans]|uniref:hypothetical protein n=1 Tax=Burkholderia multivorans TaxID=87883 RepID=UPI002019C8AE|nr:hypothetical protein [Burkholderia multivorans]UQP00553.1 hypothetical protein L0Z36_16950 [Burkholderia multivorans]
MGNTRRKILVTLANRLVGGSAVLAAFARPTGAATTDAAVDHLERVLDPVDFGAKGDGVTDDTQALLKLAAFRAALRIDGRGRTYVVSQPIVFSRQVDLKIRLKAHGTFPQAGNMLVISGDRSVVDLDVDGNTRSLVGVKVSGNDVRGRVRGENIYGSDVRVGGGMQSVLFVTGNNCRIDVHGENLLAARATNPSVPRVLSTGAVTGCIFGSVTGNNVTALWVNQAGEVAVKFLRAYKCGNNGIYDIAAGGKIKVGTAIFEDDLGLNLQTVVSESDVSIESLIVREVWGYAAVDKGGNLKIGNYSIQNRSSRKAHQVAVAREKATTCEIEIGEVTGTYMLTAASNGGGVFQFYDGNISLLKVGRIKLELLYGVGSTVELFRQTSGHGACEIDDLALTLIDTTGRLTSSTVLSWNFPNYDRPSYLNRCSLVSSSATLRVRNVGQPNMSTMDVGLLRSDGSIVSSPTRVGQRSPELQSRDRHTGSVDYRKDGRTDGESGTSDDNK